MARELVAPALALCAACHGGGETVERGAPPLASATFYRLDAEPPRQCTAGAPCEARVVLTALAGYHVNPQYPQKLVVDAAPGLTVDGTTAFAIDRPETGSLAIRFRAERPGSYAVRGTFKLGVCNDDGCEIETPSIAIPITVR
jgi:hypothetical protein